MDRLSPFANQQPAISRTGNSKPGVGSDGRFGALLNGIADKAMPYAPSSSLAVDAKAATRRATITSQSAANSENARSTSNTSNARHARNASAATAQQAAQAEAQQTQRREDSAPAASTEPAVTTTAGAPEDAEPGSGEQATATLPADAAVQPMPKTIPQQQIPAVDQLPAATGPGDPADQSAGVHSPRSGKSARALGQAAWQQRAETAEAQARVDAGASDDAQAAFGPTDNQGFNDLIADAGALAVSARATAQEPETGLPAAGLSARDRERHNVALDGSTLPASPPLTAAVTLPRADGIAGAGATADLHVAPRLGTPGWDRAFAQRVVWMVADAQQQASLTLNPPELGPLQVVLNISASQASADFSSAQPEVRQALQDALPRLREMLADAGVSLTQASVHDGTQQRPQSPPGGRQDSDRHAATQPTGLADSSLLSRAPSAIAGRGLVDTYA